MTTSNPSKERSADLFSTAYDLGIWNSPDNHDLNSLCEVLLKKYQHLKLQHIRLKVQKNKEIVVEKAVRVPAKPEIKTEIMIDNSKTHELDALKREYREFKTVSEKKDKRHQYELQLLRNLCDKKGTENSKNKEKGENENNSCFVSKPLMINPYLTENLEFSEKDDRNRDRNQNSHEKSPHSNTAETYLCKIYNQVFSDKPIEFYDEKCHSELLKYI